MSKVEFTSRAGGEASGELFLPAGDAKAGGVVLVQEFWGLNDHVRSIGRRLAAEGFVVLAPDLYHGKTTKSSEEAGKLMAALDKKQAVDEIAGAVTFLKEHARGNGKVGVIGFCLGGALTLAAAAGVPEVDAAVPFYGVPQQADFSKVRAPILAHFAKKDGWAKPELAQKIKAEVESHGGSMELHVYDADHAFFNDTRPEVHDPEAAKLAWERSIAFFHQHLG